MRNFMTSRMRWAFVLAGAVLGGLMPRPAQGTVAIDLVTVGDAGNAGEWSGDPNYGTQRLCGAVPYVYQIGKYEVTNAQYRSFLNSVARYGDPYALYKRADQQTPGVDWHMHGGIQRTGGGTIGDPYVYIPKDNDPNWDSRPGNYVTWYSSLRFINWFQNGQPVSEAGPGVTETGTYTFTDPSTVTIPDHTTLPPSTSALPTEDEWYKAAYYRGGGTSAGYWDYATQSDAVPSAVPPSGDTGNSANYDFAVDLVSDVGAYTLSVGPYGSYDQNGNVWEVLETLDDDLDGYLIRGSSWAYAQYGLPANARGFDAGPDMAVSDGGFRVVLIPEPASALTLLAAGTFIGLIHRRRR